MSESYATVEIPNRALFKAAEVCDLIKVQPYVLRSWEAEFPDLGVAKSEGAPRVYRRADVEQVARIKHLLLVEGNTASFTDLMAAVDYAKTQPGVRAISNSYGGTDSASIAAYDSHYSANNIAITASTTVIATILRPVRRVIDLSGCTSDSRTIPSGVISNAHEKISAAGKPSAIRATKTFITHGGASNVGNKIDAACTTSQLTTAYATATL